MHNKVQILMMAAGGGGREKKGLEYKIWHTQNAFD